MERKTQENYEDYDEIVCSEFAFIHDVAQKLRSEDGEWSECEPYRAAMQEMQYVVDAGGLIGEIHDWAADVYDAKIERMADVLVFRFANGERFCLHIKKLADKSDNALS